MSVGCRRITAYRHIWWTGDPDRGRHRKDDPATVEKMRLGKSV